MNRSWIESRIPHKGRMCLLDEVLEWDDDRIRCASAGHRAADHPLRAHGRLGMACGIEIAAQTMAVHGALSADASTNRPRAGLLAGVRNVRLFSARLDDVATDLVCEATRMAGDEGTALYEFVLRASDSILMSGRATVVLDARDRWSR